MIQSLRNLVLKDFWLKLFSFALAVLFWLGANLAINKEGVPGDVLSFTPDVHRAMGRLPVMVLTSAQNARSVAVSPKDVDVIVQGDRQVLEKLQPKDIRVMLDLTGIGGAQALRKRIEVSTPAGVTPIRVEPEEVEVVFASKN